MLRNFKLRVTDLWKVTTQGLSNKMKRIVNDKVENHIKHRPYDQEPLQGSLEGLWSYNKLKSDNRIIFAICEDCRKRGLTSVNNCYECEKFSDDDTIMLWAFGGHDFYKRLERKRKKTWKKAKKKKRLKLRGH